MRHRPQSLVGHQHHMMTGERNPACIRRLGCSKASAFQSASQLRLRQRDVLSHQNLLCKMSASTSPSHYLDLQAELYEAFDVLPDIETSPLMLAATQHTGR
jgi:hypothetical protein